MLKQIELGGDSEVEFADASKIGDYAEAAVNALSAAGILSGDTDGYFEPDAFSTRAQVAKILNSFR